MGKAEFRSSDMRGAHVEAQNAYLSAFSSQIHAGMYDDLKAGDVPMETQEIWFLKGWKSREATRG